MSTLPKGQWQWFYLGLFASMLVDKLLASVLKIYRSNKTYKFVSTGTVSISTWQKR